MNRRRASALAAPVRVMAVAALLFWPIAPLAAQAAAPAQQGAQAKQPSAPAPAGDPFEAQELLEDFRTGLGHAAVRLPIAALLGTALALRPRRAGSPRRDAAVIETQIVLAIVGALIMLVVGASLARAFGIAGAANLQGQVAEASMVAANSISWFVDNTHNETVLYVNTTATANHVDMEIHLTGTNINLTGSDILHHA